MEHYVGSNTEKIFRFILHRWSAIEEILKILKVFYDVTIRLQRVQYTLSDFYGDWLLCELKIQKLMSNTVKETNLSEKFVWSMDKRKGDLIKNRAMLCAIFLDPRFRLNLTTPEVALVKHLLEDTWVQVQKLKGTRQDTNTNAHDLQETSDDLLESFLSQESNPPLDSLSNTNTNNGGSPDYSKSKADFMIMVCNYELNTSRIHHSNSVLDFWQNSKQMYAELYEVAMIYLSIPPTQSTVERSFSTLSFIYNSRRSKLSLKTLENIIIIKLNADLALNIFAEDLNEI